MKILFTADLHLNIPRRSPHTGLTVLEALSGAVIEHDPDVVVVAGDIGTPAKAIEFLKDLRKAVGNRLLAIALGNHDFWLHPSLHAQYPGLDEIVANFWEGAVREADAILLDRENLEVGDYSIVGGYGHFDLGLAQPNLRVGGQRVTREVYLEGGVNGLLWNDFQFIPNCAEALREESKSQADGLALRMDRAISQGKRLLTAVHTCPWRELNGHPTGQNDQDIFLAYSGNSQVGKVMMKRTRDIELVSCGHTHVPVPVTNLHGVRSLNIGADYGIFRGIIFDTASGRIRWIGEPI